MPACDGDPSPVPISRPLLCFDQDLACKAKGGSTWHISRTSSSQPMRLQQFSFWWTGVRPKGHTGLEKDWAAILGRLGLIQGRDGGARQPAERRAALL